MLLSDNRVNYFFTGDVSGLSRAAEESINLLGKYGKKIEELSNNTNTMTARNLKGSTSFTKMNKSVSILQKSMSGLTGILKSFIGVPVGSMLKDATQESIAYVENLNLFNVAMGEAVDVGKEFIDLAQENFGLDPSNLMRYTGVFYQLADATNMASESAGIMSLGLTKLAIDTTSLFNMPIDTVMTNISSGLQGMTRAVRKYGLDIRVSTLQTTAATLGMHQNVAAMSEANRQGLRYITMLKQLGKIQGDYAKTIETPANQLRVLKEQLSQLGRAFGNFIQMRLMKILPILNGITMALRQVLTGLAALMGFKPMDLGGSVADAEAFSDGFDDIAHSADGAAKAIKGMTAPFDELNILQEQASPAGIADFGIMDPALEAAIARYELALESVRMKANDIRDAILNFFGITQADEGGLVFDPRIIEKNLIERFPQWEQTISGFFSNVGKLTSNSRKLFEKSIGNITSYFEGFIQNVKGLDWDGIFSTIIEKTRAISDWLVELDLSSMVVFDAGVIEEHGRNMAALLATGFDSFKDLASQIIADALAIIEQTRLVESLMTIVAGLGRIAYKIIETVTGIVYDMVVIVGQALAKNVGPIILAFVRTISIWMDTLAKIWTFLEPLFEKIIQYVQRLWDSSFKETFERIISIVLHAVEMVIAFVGAVGYLVGLFIERYGPLLSMIFEATFLVLVHVIEFVMDKINGLLRVFDGILIFLSGVFQADWGKIWEGVSEMFKGAIDILPDWVKDKVNGIIGFLNKLVSVFVRVVNYIKDLLNELSFDVPDWVPKIGGETWGFSMEHSVAPQIPLLAEGGVVTRPTMALVGEGAYSEAVIPLGESPQMKDMITQIVRAMKESDSDIPVNVTMSLDGEVVYRNQQKVSRNRGVNFGMGAFAR